MKKILVVLLGLFISGSVFCDVVSLEKIPQGADVLSKPLRDNANALENVINGNLDGNDNIKLGGIYYNNLSSNMFTNKTEFNNIFGDGIIDYLKLDIPSLFITGGNGIIYNNVANYIDIRYNSSIFEKGGSHQLDIKDNGITGDKLNSNVAGNGLIYESDSIAVKVGNGLVNENDSIALSGIDINGDGDSVGLNYAIQINGETLTTDDTSSLINAINNLSELMENTPKYLDTPIVMYSFSGTGDWGVADVDELYFLTTELTDLNPKALIIETSFYYSRWEHIAKAGLWIEDGSVANIVKSDTNIFWGFVPESDSGGSEDGGGNVNSKILRLNGQTSIRYTFLLNCIDVTGSGIVRIIGYY